MATRAVLTRRRLLISRFYSQSTAAVATASPSTNASTFSADNDDKKPAPIPSTTLFVSGLNKRTTSEKLGEAFSKFGEVVHAKVVLDRNSGFSKGFGFVRYATLQEAERGMKGMDAQFLDGWVIFAEYARPKVPPGYSSSSPNYEPNR